MKSQWVTKTSIKKWSLNWQLRLQLKFWKKKNIMTWLLCGNKRVNLNISFVKGLKLIFLYMKRLFCPKTLLYKPEVMQNKATFHNSYDYLEIVQKSSKEFSIRALTQNTIFKKKKSIKYLHSKIMSNLMYLCHVNCHVIKP